MNRQINRGDIYFANLEPVVGSEQGGERPVLVIQNNVGNKYSPTVMVTAITSRVSSKKVLPTHVLLTCVSLPKNSMALLEQVRTIDKTRLGSYVCAVGDEDMKSVEDALLISVGMEEQHNENRI